ncbi:MAG: glycosyltransferase [Tissierellia bacterium]|nr:glycosyltransferase [Tissierellia bacterium]
MKNIYIVDEYISSQKNGIGTFLKELIYCLNHSGNNLNLIIFNATTKEFNITDEGRIKKIVFPVFKHGHYLEYSKIIEKFFKLYIPDSLNNIFLLNHSPCSDFIKSIKNILPLSKIVFTIHDFGWTNYCMGNFKEYKYLVNDILPSKDEEKTKKEFIRKIYQEEEEMYRLADRIICLSEDSYAVLRTIYNLDKNRISLIPSGMREAKIVKTKKEIEEIKESLNIRNNEKILLVIGRPTKQKGIFALMEAMKLILKTNRNVRLVIIGDANEQSFRELVEKASFAATSITFTGLLDKYSLHKWLSIADIGIIPSYYEQFGFVGVEMMMYGLPIVASDGMGVKNMFKNDINAVIAKIGSRNRPNEYTRNLAKSILKLLDSPDLCFRLGIFARRTYEEKYKIDYMKNKYEKLVESL